MRFRTCRGPVHWRVQIGVGVGVITGTSVVDGVGVGSGAGGDGVGVGVGSGAGGVVDLGDSWGGGGGGGLGGGIGTVTLGHTVGVVDGITIGTLVVIIGRGGIVVVVGTGFIGTHLHRDGLKISVSEHDSGTSSPGQKQPQSLKV